MNRNFLLTIGASLLLLGLGRQQAHAYTHPCIPTTREELDTIKANLDKQPWKQGYTQLANASTSQLDWPMEGPWAEVGRTPDVNLTYWKDDMTAVYNLARMWYFTGNNAYAQKAHDILLAWANTHTSFTGQEISLSLGDFAAAYVGGADILRGTWPGWTAADTTAVKNYFLNVYWPACFAGANVTGPANKGSLNMEAGIAIAAFLDDTVKFDHVVDLFRTFPSAGLTNTLPTGEMGETGRDAGHAYGDLLGKAFVCEVAWKQGIDLYSELDNRLLAVGEYYARNTFMADNPFVPFGSIDYNYYANADGPYTASRAALYLIQNAYKNRKNLPTPWIDRKLEEQPVDGSNWMYAKAVDFSTATAPAAVVRPAVSPASSGLTLTTLGTQTAGRSAAYANGVWTVTGLGGGVWTGVGGADDCQFVYQTMTGDCAMVAQVTSATYSGSNNGKVGLMLRDSLSATISQRGWIGIIPAATNIMEGRQDGWTETWGGSNWSRRSQNLPPGMPYWLKIERRGNLINTYTSQDGTSWAGHICSYYGNLPATVYVGLFVCSGNTTATTVTFANVSFTGGTGGLVTTPPAPAALIATGSSKAISVRWLPSFGATAYDLLRSTTSGGGYTALASNLPADKTSYVDTAVTAGTTYYYVARAKNAAGTSGNSPQFGAALLPSPLVNLAFSGTASDNDNSVASNSANGFDQDPGSLWFHSGTSGWLQYDFGAGNAQAVKRYTVSSSSVNIPARDPKNWQFQASNDGTTWTTLDTQSGQAFATIRMQQNTYNIGNTTAYRYYRFNVTANNGDSTFTHLGDIGLWSDTGRTIPNGVYALTSRKSNKVLDLVSGGTADGTDAVQWSWGGGNSQKWNLTWLGSGQYQATGVASKLLEVTGASTSNGAVVQIWPSNNNNCQKWNVVPAGDGTFKLLNVNSGKAVDVTSGSTADGAAIIQWTDSGAVNQQWLFAPFSVTATTRLQSYNFPTRYVRHYAFHARLDENVSPVEDSQFRVRIGLTSSAGVSFESVNYAGYYLRVRSNGEVWVDKNDGTAAFRDSATFVRVPGLADSSKSSFRMWTDSTRYLRHSNYWLYAQSGSGSAFNADATFTEVAP
jgi:regulation of enolase protein 1 (concanavalin A-like superfamily)